MKRKAGEATEAVDHAKLSVRVDPGFLRMFKAACALHDKTMNEAVVEAVSEWIERYFPGFMAGRSPDGLAVLQGKTMPTVRERKTERKGKRR